MVLSFSKGKVAPWEMHLCWQFFGSARRLTSRPLSACSKAVEASSGARSRFGHWRRGQSSSSNSIWMTPIEFALTQG